MKHRIKNLVDVTCRYHQHQWPGSTHEEKTRNARAYFLSLSPFHSSKSTADPQRFDSEIHHKYKAYTGKKKYIIDSIVYAQCPQCPKGYTSPFGYEELDDQCLHRILWKKQMKQNHNSSKDSHFNQHHHHKDSHLNQHHHKHKMSKLGSADFIPRSAFPKPPQPPHFDKMQLPSTPSSQSQSQQQPLNKIQLPSTPSTQSRSPQQQQPLNKIQLPSTPSSQSQSPQQPLNKMQLPSPLSSQSQQQPLNKIQLASPPSSQSQQQPLNKMKMASSPVPLSLLTPSQQLNEKMKQLSALSEKSENSEKSETSKFISSSSENREQSHEEKLNRLLENQQDISPPHLLDDALNENEPQKLVDQKVIPKDVVFPTLTIEFNPQAGKDPLPSSLSQPQPSSSSSSNLLPVTTTAPSPSPHISSAMTTPSAPTTLEDQYQAWSKLKLELKRRIDQQLWRPAETQLHDAHLQPTQEDLDRLTLPIHTLELNILKWLEIERQLLFSQSLKHIEFLNQLDRLKDDVFFQKWTHMIEQTAQTINASVKRYIADHVHLSRTVKPPIGHLSDRQKHLSSLWNWKSKDAVCLSSVVTQQVMDQALRVLSQRDISELDELMSPVTDLHLWLDRMWKTLEQVYDEQRMTRFLQRKLSQHVFESCVGKMDGPSNGTHQPIKQKIFDKTFELLHMMLTRQYKTKIETFHRDMLKKRQAQLFSGEWFDLINKCLTQHRILLQVFEERVWTEWVEREFKQDVQLFIEQNQVQQACERLHLISKTFKQNIQPVLVKYMNHLQQINDSGGGGGGNNNITTNTNTNTNIFTGGKSLPQTAALMMAGKVVQDKLLISWLGSVMALMQQNLTPAQFREQLLKITVRDLAKRLMKMA